MGGTSGFGSPLGSPSYTATAPSSAYYGTSGLFRSIPDPPERIPTLSSRMRKIKPNEGKKVKPEFVETHPGLIKRTLWMIRNSSYGILGLGPKKKEQPSISSRLKKIR
jgi:hypothetical protein